MARFLAIAVLLTFATASPATAATLEDFEKACGDAVNWGPKLCTCVGENGQQDLSKNGFHFLVLTLEKKQAEIDALRPKLSLQELMSATTYMMKGPKKCAAALAE